MSLMFFLSGLFVWPSLARKGSWTFLRDRMVRIGLPLVLVVIFVMPVAYYPAYRLTAVDPSVTGYWRQWMSLPFWPCGPQWFLLQLLALNVVAAVLYRWAPQWGGPLGWLVFLGADPSNPLLHRLGNRIRPRLCANGLDLFTVGMGPSRSIRRTTQPSAAL